MLGIARLAEKGPVPAAIVAASLLVLGLFFTALLPFGLLFAMALMAASSAVIAFVILRHGQQAGLRTASLSTLLLSLVSLGLFRSPVQIPLFELAFWAPAALAAMVLVRSVRLELAVITIALCGLVTVVVMHWFAGDTEAWRMQLADFLARTGGEQSDVFTAEQIDILTASMASIRTGAMGVSIMTFAFAGLFIARYWQAALVNPGGFQKEFHSLRLGRQAALVCAATIALAVLVGGSLWSGFAMVAIFALFVQGLSVCHALVKQRGLSQGWLVGIYLLLLLPHTVLLLGALGLADNLYHLRQA
jgi:hypothetical protein